MYFFKYYLNFNFVKYFRSIFDQFSKWVLFLFNDLSMFSKVDEANINKFGSKLNSEIFQKITNFFFNKKVFILEDKDIQKFFENQISPLIYKKLDQKFRFFHYRIRQFDKLIDLNSTFLFNEISIVSPYKRDIAAICEDQVLRVWDSNTCQLKIQIPEQKAGLGLLSFYKCLFRCLFLLEYQVLFH